MLEKEQIDKILEETITGLGFEFVCSELFFGKTAKSSNVIRIYIDKEDVGVNLEDCVKTTRHLNNVLAVESSAASEYSLEVSSPGLDRPLVKPEHFKRFMGKKVKIKLNLPIATIESNAAADNKQRNIVGYIEDVTSGNAIVINIKKGDAKKGKEIVSNCHEIDFANISKANLVPEWK